MRKISIKAVVAGTIVNFAATLFGAFITAITIVNSMVIQPGGATPGHLTAAQMTPPPGTPLAILLISFAACVLGGYVAGRIAKQNAPLNGALSAFLTVLLALAGAFAPNADDMAQLAAIMGSPGFALLGGYIAQFQQSRAA